MDEGTSHLDLDREREVNRALAALNITRIVIAHRPDTIRAADRIIALEGGKVSCPSRLDTPAVNTASLAFA
jgi:ATP-binding cassette subfamily B protein RaxB